MKISPEILVGLKRLCNKSLVSDENFRILLKEVVLVLTAESRNDDTYLSEFKGARIDILKEAFAAVLTLLTESSKNNLSDTSFSSVLESYNLHSERLQELVKIYCQHCEKFQNNLKSFSHHLPHITDVRWRLNYFAKSSRSSGSGCLLYYVQFICQSSSGLENTLDFTCTVEQLQELVEKLQDATRRVDKIGNLSKC